jgi:hypothetical protein
VAKWVARRLAGRQARVRFPARHHREIFPTEPQAMRGWREASANVLYVIFGFAFAEIFVIEKRLPESGRRRLTDSVSRGVESESRLMNF